MLQMAHTILNQSRELNKPLFFTNYLVSNNLLQQEKTKTVGVLENESN